MLVMSDTMNRFALFIAAIGVLLYGCNKPGPVELQQDDASAILEVSSVAQTDSNLGLATVDSSAVLPEDQGRFACLLQVARITFDAGQVVDTTLAFAHVIVEDRNRPVQVGNRIVGYFGMNLGFVTIGANGKITAEIQAKTVMVIGEVVGNITADDKVEVAATGSMRGDIVAPRVVLADGARFKGSIDMDRKPGAPGAPPRPGIPGATGGAA